VSYCGASAAAPTFISYLAIGGLVYYQKCSVIAVVQIVHRWWLLRRSNLRTKAEPTATRRRRATRMSDAQPTPSNVRVEIAVDGTTSFETSGTLQQTAAATNAHLTSIVEKDKTERDAKKAKS
jgi:hypothetical protein